jgi:chromosome segregation ATPase
LEGVVETQGKQIKEQQKSKWPLARLRKQPSKDKGDECAQAIQEKETKIREKESEIRMRDEQIEHYRKKLDIAEALDEQSVKLATELSEKENKVQEVSRQLLDLQQEMKTVMAKNARLKEQIVENQTKHEDEIKKQRAKYKQQARSDAAVELVVISDDEQQNLPSIKEELARLRSHIATLEADLEKSVTHSKGQSREILKLRQQIQGIEVSSNK